MGINSWQPLQFSLSLIARAYHCATLETLQCCQHCRVPFRHPKREKQYRFLTWKKREKKISEFFLSLYFMCSGQHVKYWMPRGFPLTSSLLLDYHLKQHTRTYSWDLLLNYTYIHCTSSWELTCGFNVCTVVLGLEASIFLFIFSDKIYKKVNIYILHAWTPKGTHL